jgi:hypothetical protein
LPVAWEEVRGSHMNLKEIVPNQCENWRQTFGVTWFNLDRTQYVTGVRNIRIILRTGN